MNIVKNNKWKVLNIFLIVIALSVYFSSDWYWTYVCANNGCEVVFLSAILAPLKFAGIMISFILLPFIFIPQHYFKAYFKQVFWWGFAFAFIWVASNDPNSSNLLTPSPQQAVYNQGLIWGVVTILFIVFHWWVTKKGWPSRFHLWFLLVPITVIILFPFSLAYL